MDVIRLRTLTEKSKIGFGVHADLKVGDLINIKKKWYLRWLYFNFSAISFVDEVLDKILITLEYRIEKPGTDRELGKKLSKELILKYGLDEKAFKKKTKEEKKARLLRYYVRDKTLYTRKNLQYVNHGH